MTQYKPERSGDVVGRITFGNERSMSELRRKAFQNPVDAAHRIRELERALIASEERLEDVERQLYVAQEELGEGPDSWLGMKRRLQACEEALREIGKRPCRTFAFDSEGDCNTFKAEPKCETCISRAALDTGEAE